MGYTASEDRGTGLRIFLPVILIVAGSVCASSSGLADDPTPIDKPSPTAGEAPPTGAPDERPAGEVQERAVAAAGADPFVGIDGTAYHVAYPVVPLRQETLHFVNVFSGNYGTVPSNNNFTVNLTVTDAGGKTVCSAATNVTSAVQPNSTFTAVRFQIRMPGPVQSQATPVLYTLSAKLQFWSPPSAPSADLNPQNDQAQAPISLPSGGTPECVVASPPQIRGVSVTPGLLPGGQAGTGSVMLTTPPPQTVTVSGGTTNTSSTLNIQLASNKPQAAVPTSVSIAYPNLVASFPVNTSPVETSQTATISATFQGAGSAPVGTNVTVRPPALSALTCSSSPVASGTPIHCTVLLDGTVAGSLIGLPKQPPPSYAPQIQVRTSPTAIASYPAGTVTVWPGQHQTPFDVPTSGVSQTALVTIFALYQGVEKNAPVQVTASLIKDFGCFVGTSGPPAQGASACTITPYSRTPYGVIAHLVNPVANQVTIPLSEPGRLHHASYDHWFCCWPSYNPAVGYKAMTIPAGQAAGYVYAPDDILLDRQVFVSYFEPVPATETHTISVVDPLSHANLTATFTVLPARITGIGFGETPSAATNPATINSVVGQKVKVWALFNAPPAPTDWQSQNAWLDVRYGGNVAIQGPTNVAIQEQICSNTAYGSIGGTNQCSWRSPPPPPYVNFEVTLGACSAAVHPNGCQATVSVSSNQALGTATGTINVTPQ
jgi:hypothetical protein